MAMGKSKEEPQGQFWIEAGSLADSPGHPFYSELNKILAKEGFEAFLEGLCAPHYADKKGRPSIPPGVYFRMLLIGYFERIDSERGIAWRCADSLSLREFLGIPLDQQTPDHSSLSRIRTRLPLEVHQDVFRKILSILAHHKLIHGKTVGVDSTTLEANAALRSIIRKDTGESYESFLTLLAKESGIETPTREDLARLDRKRPKKGSNDDWQNPNDPDAQISKMKDGSTHMAHKAEHAVDMGGEGAVLAVTIHGGATGDTQTLPDTLHASLENLKEVRHDETCRRTMHSSPISETVTDKGYHSNEVMVYMKEAGIRSYVSEPKRGRRDWSVKSEAKTATYANRRRIRGVRGKALLRRRGELLERPFAHYLEAGGMRRTHLRGHENILKRLLVHVAGFNLSIVMRKILDKGTPRELASALLNAINAIYSPTSLIHMFCNAKHAHWWQQFSIPKIWGAKISNRWRLA